MNILSNKKAVVTLLLSLSVIIVAGFTTYPLHRGTSKTIDCLSSLRLDSTAEDFYGDFNLFLFMDANNIGYLSMSGIATHHNSQYHVERSYRFHYARNSGDTYHLTDISLSARAGDNIDSGLITRVFFSEDAMHGRYVKIKSLHNAYLIEMTYSPVFICVPH